LNRSAYVFLIAKKTRCNKECVSEIIFNPESGEEVEGTEYVVTPHYGDRQG